MENYVRLTYPGRVKKAKAAVDKANEILRNPEFYDQIRGYKKFDNTDLSPEVIANLMEERSHEIIVDLSFLMLMANASTHSPNRITLSFWNFSKDLPSAVNTLIHETVNAMDRLHSTIQDKPMENKARPTAPWVIGAIAEIMVK
jgi:hypothetical protein